MIYLALRRVGSVKNDLVTGDINEIYKYLAADERMDAEEVKKIIDDHHEHPVPHSKESLDA